MANRKKHINIPIFIPHLGCPNQCVFCNQHAISGNCSFRKEDIVPQIETVLSTVSGDTDCEIAFFGGSFTGIDRELMRYCLDTAESYVRQGRVSGIRMSTRPDYITEEILEILRQYTVTAVELGVQSLSDRVLSVCRRGHTAGDTYRAVRLLHEFDIPFVGQMMVGLPTSTAEDEIFCAEEISSLGAVGCRIYPTVVFRETELGGMTERGEYTPLTIEEAAERAASVLDVFVRNGVQCLRIGLCDSENLHSDAYCSGPNHPAMGELTGSALYLKRICREADRLSGSLNGENLVIQVPKGDISLAVGQKQGNKRKIIEKYHLKSLKFLENGELMRYNIILGTKKS